MARQGTKEASNNYNALEGTGNTANQRASASYGALFPQLISEINNPTGYTARQLADANTAAQQSVGGATAGAVGQGDLEAARTRNAGAFAPALDAAARSGQQALSQDALGIQMQNANLEQQKKQSALRALQGLLGNENATAVDAYGQGNGAINAGTNAGKSGWFQNMIALGQNAANAATGMAAAGA